MESQSNKKNSKLWELFSSFFKIGLFTFGGGIAMLPLIENETVNKRKWVKEEEILDMVALAESTPGVIAVNSATYIGYKVSGFMGALVATSAVIIPSFTIICIITLFLDEFLKFQLVQWALGGIKACVAILILNAVLSLNKHVSKNIFSYILMAAGFAISFFFPDFPTIFIIIGAGILGVIVYTLYYKYKKPSEKGGN